MYRPAPRYFICLFLSVCLFLLGAGPTAPAQAETARRTLSADEIKAAYLFNFAKFVDWPLESFASDVEPLQVCFLGGESVSKTFRSLEGKTIKGRSLQTKIVTQLEDLQECHILFIGDSELPRWPQIQDFLDQSSVLTVSDSEGFTDQGGMISFKPQNNRIRFLINLDNTQSAGLKLSSQLLQLAEVTGNKQKGGPP